MRLLFIKETKIADLHQPLQRGQDAIFLQPFAEKMIKAGNAVSIPDGMTLTETNREFIIIQQETKQKRLAGK